MHISCHLLAIPMVSTGSLDWLQTLADSTRVRLLRLLTEQELAVSEMCTVVQLPQSTVSRHLKVLAADEWVRNRKEGTNNLYRAEVAQWCGARNELWSWVRGQADSRSIQQDDLRLARVLAQRSRSEAFFSSTAEHWDRLRIELFGPQMDTFILAASLPSYATVVELGSGSAPLCQLIAPFVKQAIAVDNSQAMLAAAKQQLTRHNNVRIVNATLSDTGLEDHCCDCAWLVLVLPYLDDPVAVLNESRRILKPGASLVIADLLPHDRDTYRQEMGHLRQGVAQAELEEWLAASRMHLTAYRAIPPDPSAKGPALFTAAIQAVP